MSGSIDDQSISTIAGGLGLAGDGASIRRRLHLLTGNSFLERAIRWIGSAEIEQRRRTARNADQLIASSFAGNAVSFKSFMETLSHTSLGKMDFNAFVESGSAKKLIELQREHPTWFDAIRAGEFQDTASLGRKIDEMRVKANEVIHSRARSTLSIPLGDGLPGEMACAVTKKGDLSCDWKAAQGPVEREAAHLLKAGADLLAAAAQSIQKSSAPGTKR